MYVVRGSDRRGEADKDVFEWGEARGTNLCVQR